MYLTCNMCRKIYPTQRALSLHLSKTSICTTFVMPMDYQMHHLSRSNICNNQNALDSHLQANKDTIYNESNISINEDKSYCTTISSNSGNSILSHSFHHTNDINHEIKLLKLINDIGAPLYTYEKIMQWANESYQAGYKFNTKNKKYQTTIDCLEEQYKFSICCPTNVPVSLYGDNAEINVVVLM